MEKTSIAQEGFEGVLYEASSAAEKKCLILNLLFAPNSSFAKKPALWLNEHGVSALALGENYGRDIWEEALTVSPSCAISR